MATWPFFNASFLCPKAPWSRRPHLGEEVQCTAPHAALRQKGDEQRVPRSVDRCHGAQKPVGKSPEIPSKPCLTLRVSTGYESGKELLGEATSKKHRILRIHMTCYYPKTSDSENTHDMLLWASMGHSIYTCSHVCVCISICTHTHEINAYTEQSSCQKDIRIYSGDFGPRHSLLLSL